MTPVALFGEPVERRFVSRGVHFFVRLRQMPRRLPWCTPRNQAGGFFPAASRGGFFAGLDHLHPADVVRMPSLRIWHCGTRRMEAARPVLGPLERTAIVCIALPSGFRFLCLVSRRRVYNNLWARGYRSCQVSSGAGTLPPSASGQSSE